MRNSLSLLFLAGMISGCETQESKMPANDLIATIECVSKVDCFRVRSGQSQIPVAIKISNNSSEAVEFPVSAFEDLFLYASYENSSNGMKYTVPAPPQDFSGKYDGVEIPPGGHVILNDVIYPEYIKEVVDESGASTQEVTAKFSVPNTPGGKNLTV